MPINAVNKILIDDIIADRKNLPFYPGKDAVIIGRGEITRYRYYFNIEKVNLFSLNFTLENASNYKKDFPDFFESSVFSFVHKGHYNQLVRENKLSGNVITWNFDNEVFKHGNVLPSCANFLGYILKSKYIYFLGLDFDQPLRSFRGEVKGLQRAIGRYGTPLEIENSKKNKYVFLTPNRHFLSYMDNSLCSCFVRKLKDENIIIKEFSNVR